MNVLHEDFLRERRMHTLPEVRKALEITNAFHDSIRSLPEEKQHLTDGISSYICYMETIALKLAHYFGFVLADSFLPHVVPGYCPDDVTTFQYKWDLQKYLQLNLDQLQ